MPTTDPIADMLTRLRNGLKQRHSHITLPASKMKKAILDVLVAEGYVSTWSEENGADGHANIRVELKYHQGKPVLTSVDRVSKPGRRVYSGHTDIPMVANGLGITIVSTSQGVMTDSRARGLKIGGEILCQVM